MPIGDVTCVNYGQHAVSGAALAAVISDITLTTESGQVLVIPSAVNQVTVLTIEVEAL